jgi:hypothetical protein
MTMFDLLPKLLASDSIAGRVLIATEGALATRLTSKTVSWLIGTAARQLRQDAENV